MSYLPKIIKNTYKQYRFAMRDLLVTNRKRNELHNKGFSIIASDCTGGMIYHDLHQRFDSPTVNLYFMADGFIKFCNNLKETIDLPMIEIKNHDFEYPVAQLGDSGICLYLVHYKNVKEAQEKWNERKERINWNNMFFVMNDRNGCTDNEIKAFDELPYYNKVCFTHVSKPEYKSSYFIKGFEKSDYVDTMTAFCNPISIHRNFDQFDYVSWLNYGGLGSMYYS